MSSITFPIIIPDAHEFTQIAVIQNIALHLQDTRALCPDPATWVKRRLDSYLETTLKTTQANGCCRVDLSIRKALPIDQLPDDEDSLSTVFRCVMHYYYLALTPKRWSVHVMDKHELMLTCVFTEPGMNEFLSDIQTAVNQSIRPYRPHTHGI